MKKGLHFIKQAREFMGISQRELGNIIGMTGQHVSNIETGSKPMKRQTRLAVECLLRREGRWNEFKNYRLIYYTPIMSPHSTLTEG
jgi:transcriptional regulator with XRE-family HTH domain